MQEGRARCGYHVMHTLRRIDYLPIYPSTAGIVPSHAHFLEGPGGALQHDVEDFSQLVKFIMRDLVVGGWLPFCDNLSRDACRI